MELNTKLSLTRAFEKRPDLQATLFTNVKDPKAIQELASLSGVSVNFLGIHSDELQRLLWSIS